MRLAIPTSFRLTADENELLLQLELAFTMFALLFFSATLIAVPIPLPLQSLGRYIVPFVSFVLLCLRWKMSLYTIKGDPFLLILCLLSSISYRWALVPHLSWAASREMVSMYLFGVYFASRYKIREQLIFLALSLEVTVLLSIYHAFITGRGIMRGGPFDGAWSGVYTHKNILSTVMTMSIAVHLSLLFDSSFNRKHAAIGLVMSIFVTLMSTSKSGLVIFIALVGAIMLLRSLRWKNLVMVMIFSLLFGISIPGMTVIFGNWDFLMVDILDKDPTMSGRTDIWAYAAEMLEREERTLFGYGRAVFWDPSLPYSKGAGDRVMGVTTLYSKAEYNPPNAHNGWVDMMLEVGYVGVSLMVMSLSLFLARALRRVYITTTPEEFGPLAFIFFFLFYNMTESLMLRSETIFWMTYISFAYGIRLGGQEEIPDHPPLQTQRAKPREPKRLQAQAPSIARWR